MPFDCGNITLPNANCYQLLKYCNNNFGTRDSWCMCMVSNDSKYDCSDFPLVVLAVIIPAGLMVIAFMVIAILNCYNSTKKTQNATDLIKNNTTTNNNDFLQPIATNIRKNALGIQPPMKIPNEIVIEEVPQYEEHNLVKPPEYDV